MSEHERKAQDFSMPVYAAMALLVLVLAFNQYQLSTLSNQILLYSAPALGAGGSVGQQPASGATSGASLQAVVDRVIPKGVPDVYGSELGVSYDKPVESLTILGKLDGDLYPDGTLKFADLDSDAQQRYVALGKMIACEYCCGATELVFSNGQPACGCQHSAAMRGLAKYLLLKHPDLEDSAILEEMAKWKILFFPKQHISKAVSFASSGMDSNINPTDLASNEFRGFKASSSSQSQSSSQNIANAPDMVGGC
ncbi:MAG: hypothetical protein QXR53_00305 [Candidatus Norongarragalinales archaeon]